MAREKKFTPGPWRYVENELSPYKAGSIRGVKFGVCQLFGGYQDEVHANYSLISAAPELLKALELVVEAFQTAHYGDYDMLADVMFDAINSDQVKTAIAKAYGEGE